MNTGTTYMVYPCKVASAYIAEKIDEHGEWHCVGVFASREAATRAVGGDLSDCYLNVAGALVAFFDDVAAVKSDARNMAIDRIRRGVADALDYALMGHYLNAWGGLDRPPCSRADANRQNRAKALRHRLAALV